MSILQTSRGAMVAPRAALTMATLVAATLLAPTLVAAPGSARAASACGESYTVSPGDTLEAIAKRCGTTVAALVGANPVIENPARITVGWELTIPAERATLGPGAEVRASERGPEARAALADGVYEVRPGDSFASIATALKVPMRALRAANQGVNPFRLRPGQTLQLPAIADAQHGMGEVPRSGAAAEEPGPAAEPMPAPATGAPDVAEQTTSKPRSARTGEVEKTEAEASPAVRLSVQGRVRRGSECPVLETPDGELFALVSTDYGFTPGEYVAIEGETVEISFCMADMVTLRVRAMVAAPQGRDG